MSAQGGGVGFGGLLALLGSPSRSLGVAEFGLAVVFFGGLAGGLGRAAGAEVLPLRRAFGQAEARRPGQRLDILEAGAAVRQQVVAPAA